MLRHNATPRREDRRALCTIRGIPGFQELERALHLQVAEVVMLVEESLGSVWAMQVPSLTRT